MYRPELVNFNELEDYAGIKLLFTDNHSKLLAVRDQILKTMKDYLITPLVCLLLRIHG
jgi:hypothetical protein